MPTTAATNTNLDNNNHIDAQPNDQSKNNNSTKRPLEITETHQIDTESHGDGSGASGTGSCGAKRKFDAILDEVIDTQKIDFKHVRRWLRDYIADKQRNHDYLDLVTDLIVDYLKKERFPDAKVIQCEIADFGFLGSDNSKKLMRRLWSLMNDLQCEVELQNASKYRKASLSSGSTTKISTSTRNDKYHYYKPHPVPAAYSSYSYYSHHANQL